jgi:hypothetical protein
MVVFLVIVIAIAAVIVSLKIVSSKKHDREFAELKVLAAEGNPLAIKKLVERGTWAHQYISYFSSDPERIVAVRALRLAIKIMCDMIIRDGGGDYADEVLHLFTASNSTRTGPGMRQDKFEYKSPKGEIIRFENNYSENNFPSYNCSISFDLFLKMLPESVSNIADQVKQTIEDLFDENNIPIRRVG